MSIDVKVYGRATQMNRQAGEKNRMNQNTPRYGGGSDTRTEHSRSVHTPHPAESLTPLLMYPGSQRTYMFLKLELGRTRWKAVWLGALTA